MATMNDCKTVQPLLAEYVDGELGETQAWQIKMHVQSCAVCQSISDDFATTARLVSSLPVPKGPSANFEEILARRIADECLAPKPLSTVDKLRFWWEEKTASVPVGYRPTPALAGAFALLVALFPTGYFLTHSGSGTPTPNTLPSTAPVTAANLVSDDPGLTELWNEHAAFSSAQPLGDPASVLAGIEGN